jgi:hypothetical protein
LRLARQFDEHPVLGVRIDIQRPPEKKNAQACDKLIDTGAIITGE